MITRFAALAGLVLALAACGTGTEEKAASGGLGGAAAGAVVGGPIGAVVGAAAGAGAGTAVQKVEEERAGDGTAGRPTTID